MKEFQHLLYSTNCVAKLYSMSAIFNIHYNLLLKLLSVMPLLDFIAREDHIKDNKVAKTSTIYNAVRRYKELGHTKDRPKSGHPHSCTKISIKAVQERVTRYPKSFMGKMARDFIMDPKSMRKTVNTDLKHSSLKLNKCQHLTVL